MTPKQRYDERKRLRAERLLRDEQRAHSERAQERDGEERIIRLLVAFERIADVMELWADMHEPRND
jgi:hypothetical protein